LLSKGVLPTIFISSEVHFLTVRKVPIRADPGRGVPDAIFLENETLILDDQDIESLWKGGRVVSRVENVPTGFQRHAYVHLRSQSGKPIRRLIHKRADYDLVALVEETPRLLEHEGKRLFEIVLASPIASLAHASLE
jgi:hypothetical protein